MSAGCGSTNGAGTRSKGETMMLARLLAATVLAAGLLQGTAFAQDNSAKSSDATSATTENAQTLPQELADKLKDQGFTDIKVVPGSFIVSAKDKNGDPVGMVIGPHSMTMFAAISAHNKSTTGSGSGSKM
jgi:hypothetical protein